MITVMFSCKGCGVTKHKLQVPARVDEDIRDWVKGVAQHVADEHRKLSPQCQDKKCDLYLPSAGDFIGQQVE